MKIESVKIENLRSFSSDEVFFDDYTCMVGQNGSGKSTILCALNIFFRESAHSPVDLTCLHEEDFHKKQTKQPVTITVTFKDLSDEAMEDFAAYVRLDKLIVTAEAKWNADRNDAPVLQYGQRLGFTDFRPYFEADDRKAKVDELKEIYAGLKGRYSDLPDARTKEQMTEALNAYEAARPGDCVLIPSQDQFYGFSSGRNLLDKHIQWVYLPAVKDASDEQSEGKVTALGKLLSRTVRSRVSFSDQIAELRKRLETDYKTVLDGSQVALDEVSAALTTRLKLWAHPDVKMTVAWNYDKDKSIKVDEPFATILAGEGAFEGELARLGHGLQRSLMLALLQELSGHEIEGAPTLVLAIEEPELYQHPPQARYLAELLTTLAADGSQVMACSHSPFFVSGETFEDIRLVRKCPAKHESSVVEVKVVTVDAKVAAAEGGAVSPKPAGALIKLHQILRGSLNEMFFAPVVILVEGLEDVAYIATYMNLSGRWDDYRKLGCHLVPCQNKTGIIRPKAICDLFGIPAFTVFDADGDKYSDPNKDVHGNRAKHEKDNKAILALCGHPGEDPFGASELFKPNMVMWPANIGASVKSDVEDTLFIKVSNEINANYGQVGNIQKDELFIGDFVAELLNQEAALPKLDRLCQSIIDFAEASAVVVPRA